jgi:polyketide synthase
VTDGPGSSGQGADSGVCLVTGATGFIGSHLAERLVERGMGVRCLVRPTSNTSLLDKLDVELAVGDLTDANSLADAVEGCDCVFHCAAHVSDWAGVEEIARVNVAGTRSLLDAASGATVRRFVHFSTTDVYGYPGGVAVAESHPFTPFRNWYSETKRAAEREVRRAGEAGSLEIVILRPATVYGPRSTEVVAEIARAIRSGGMLLIDRGRPVAGLCYVENLVDAALLALESDAADGEAFNVTDGVDVTWRQFTADLASGLDCKCPRWSLPYPYAAAIALVMEQGYRLVHNATGLTSRPLLSRQAVHVLGRDQAFSNRKARELLGWSPRVDYPHGIEATVSWLRASN